MTLRLGSGGLTHWTTGTLVHENIGINFCTYILEVGPPGTKMWGIDGNSQFIDGNTSCTWPVLGADGFTLVENFQPK